MFNNRDGDSSKKAVLFLHAAMRTLQLHISELPFSFSGKSPHLHSMTQSLCLPFFVLRTTQASQLLSQFSQVVEGFVGYESGYRASRYIKTTESKKKKQLFFFLLLRKAVLPFWFICHYIWTFLYLHYVHVAFTKTKVPKQKHNKRKCRLLEFGKNVCTSARHDEKKITVLFFFKHIAQYQGCQKEAR